MFCGKCGAQLKEDTAFCGGCGTAVGGGQAPPSAMEDSPPQVETAPVSEVAPAAPTEPTASPVATPAEPTAPPAEADTAPVVAAPASSPPQTPPPSRQNPPVQKKKPTALIAVALAVVALGVGAYFLFFAGENGGVFGAPPSEGPRAIPYEERIMEELAQDGRSFIPGNQTIDSIEIIEYETNSDETPWVHSALVLVHSSDTEVAFTKYASLLYYRDEEREWILTEISTARVDIWQTSPLVGVGTDMIDSAVRNALRNQDVTIDGDEWRITDDTIENISIENQNTNLGNRRDVVVASVLLGSEARTAEGQVELEFTFDNGWSFSTHSGHTPFSSQYRTVAVFDLSNEQLLNELVRDDATILREMVFNGQTLSIARDEVIDFNILDYETSNRGANRLYNFSFTIQKGIITYAVQGQVNYQFDNLSGWVPGDFLLTPSISSVNLVGTRWVGTYATNVPWGQLHPDLSPALTQTILIVEIVEITADGSVRATVTGMHPEIIHTSVGSFDTSTLTLTLNFDEWIVEPPRPTGVNDRTFERERENFSVFNQMNLDGQLNATGITIAGRTVRRSIRRNFEVTLTDEVPEYAPADGEETDDAPYDDDYAEEEYEEGEE